MCILDISLVVSNLLSHYLVIESLLSHFTNSGYDPKCNLAIWKDSGVKYELRKRFTSVKLSKKLISGVNFDI